MNSIKRKILILTIIPLAFVLLIIGGLTISNKISTERELLMHRLDSYRTLLESGDLTFETSADKVKLESLLSEKVVFSEILTKSYKVIYSSENSAAPLIDDEDKKDVNDAFKGIETTKNVEAGGSRSAAFVIISPLIVNGRVVAVLHQGLSHEQSDQRILQYAAYIALFIFGGIILCLFLVSFLVDTVIQKNITALKKAALEMKEGNLNNKVEIDSDDELGILASTFDSMRDSIKTQKKQLQDYNDALEEKIKERTKELEDKNKELRHFNDLTVDRELKMIELKKQIQELEGQLRCK